MKMDEKLFPRGCSMAYDKSGGLNSTGTFFMEDQVFMNFGGRGVEHPCYACKNGDCNLRKVDYQDPERRFIIRP